MSQVIESERTQGVRQIVSSKEELRAAVVEIASLANRTLSILTPDLEPEIYDHEDFLEALKRFLLARSFARVRVLIAEPPRVFKSGNRLVDMARRLNSYIEFRNLKPGLHEKHEAYCIADDHAIAYRARYDRWDGMSDTYDRQIARKYLDEFDGLWHACETGAELRRLHL